jgi:hypothetical protein
MKRYYKIGEVAGALNVAPSAVRFWTKQFAKYLIFPGSKISKDRANKDRKFKLKEFELLHLIWYLVKVEKYTEEGAKRQLILNKAKWLKHTKQSFINKIQ